MRMLILATALLPAAAFAQNEIVAGSTLTLSQCVAIALKNDPDIKSNEYTARAQDAAASQLKSAYYPNVAATAGFLSSHAEKQNPADPVAAANIGSYDAKSAGLALNQLVYDFGKTPATVAAGRAAALSAKFDIDSQAAAVAAQVKQAFHAVVFADLALALSDEIVAQYRQQLGFAQAHFQASIRPKYDVTKAEADLSSALLDNIKALNQTLLAKAYLTNTMNVAGAPDYNVEESTGFIKYDAQFDAIVASAYAKNPDLLSLTAQADALESQYKVSRRDLFPELKASAGYNFIGSRSPISQGWTAGLTLSADIFTGMRKASKITEQENRLKALRFKIDALKLQIYLQAKQDYLNLQQHEQAYRTATMQVQEATENLEIANLRYKTGLGSPIEVTDATVLYNNAKLALLNALYQYRVAQADIEKITGSRQ